MRLEDIYPRLKMKDTNLVGFVDNEETISLGKLALNAPKQLIVRGTYHVVRSLFENEERRNKPH